MTEGEEIPVCPECGSAQLETRSWRTESDYNYYCKAEGHRFDEPDYRERRAQSTQSGLSKILDDADPDDLPA